MNFVGDEKFHEHHLLVQALEPVAFSTAVQEITNTIISAKMHHKSVASLDVDVSFITPMRVDNAPCQGSRTRDRRSQNIPRGVSIPTICHGMCCISNQLHIQGPSVQCDFTELARDASGYGQGFETRACIAHRARASHTI